MPRLDLEVDPVDRDGVAVNLPEFPRLDHAPPPFISLMAATLRATRPRQRRPQEGTWDQRGGNLLLKKEVRVSTDGLAFLRPTSDYHRFCGYSFADTVLSLWCVAASGDRPAALVAWTRRLT